MGTTAYMSSEQARGEEVNRRTDIWSLGVVLYEMLTGQLPFQGDYEQAMIYSIINEEPEPVTGLRSGVPMGLERIVLKALAKVPDERNQHLDEMLVVLHAVQKKLAGREEPAATVRPAAQGEIASRTKWPRTAVLAGEVALALITVFALLWLVKPKWRQPAAADQSKGKKIAVLPFVNLTGDTEQEYFCDGMTEQLITNLSRVPELKVIARTSVMCYKNTEKDIRQISRELDAKYVLDGSERKADRRVRITAQLIEAQEGTHLWANDYDRQLEDIFAIQDNVSQSIARTLEVAFSGQATKMVKSSYSTNVEASEAHLKTRYYIDNVYMKTRQERDFQRALEMVKRTVALDPDHYLGYFDLGYLYEARWTVTGALGDMNLERKYIRKAYSLNPALPETNAAM
ncbi:MAG: protein kinase, partial [bacterium]